MIGGERVYVIAEAGVNHNGDLNRALDMVAVAAAAGADAVKFQTFNADRLVAASAPKAAYQAAETGEGSQRDLLRSLELSPDDHEKLIAACRDHGIAFLSTPFEELSADLLEALDVPAFKIPSGEITNLPFLRHVAAKERPMLVSTGMADLDEVAAAVDAITSTGNNQFALLHCLSQYPADPREANLRAMATMARAFGCPVGYSDHTPGAAVAIAAVALGAALIEKHFTLDRNLPGPDHKASIEPHALNSLIADIRTVGAAMGDGRKRRQASEEDTARVARKSLVAVCDIPAGSRIDAGMVVARRPGTGISPAELDQVIGRTAARAIARGSLLERSDLA